MNMVLYGIDIDLENTALANTDANLFAEATQEIVNHYKTRVIISG